MQEPIEVQARLFALENVISQLWAQVLANTSDPIGTAAMFSAKADDNIHAMAAETDSATQELMHRMAHYNASHWDRVMEILKLLQKPA